MITENFVESSIASEHYFTAADGRAGAIANDTYVGVERPLANDRDLEALAHVTVCILIMNNGYKVYGVNTGSIDPVRFNAETGRQLARKDAIGKIWELLGFEARTKLANGLKPLY